MGIKKQTSYIVTCDACGCGRVMDAYGDGQATRFKSELQASNAVKREGWQQVNGKWLCDEHEG